MPQLTGQSGAGLAQGPNSPVSVDKSTSSMLVSGYRGKYGAAATDGRIVSAYAATIATSLPSTSTIGLGIWNNPGSGVRIELLRWVSQIVATSATCTGIGIAVGFQQTTMTGVTAATTFGLTKIGATTLALPLSVTAFNIATVLVAPVVVRPLHHNTAAINTVGMEMMSGEFDGEIVLEEGAFACFCALGAAAAASAHTMGLIASLIPTR